MNKWLKGNGYWCPTCAGKGGGKITDYFEYEGGGFCAFREVCPTCKGARRLAGTEADVIAGSVPQTPTPEPTCFTNLIEYGKLTPTGRLPRKVLRIGELVPVRVTISIAPAPRAGGRT